MDVHETPWPFVCGMNIQRFFVSIDECATEILDKPWADIQALSMSQRELSMDIHGLSMD